MTWRRGLSKELQYHLERIILESYSHKYAIEQAKDKGKAQLWVATSILNKKIAELELKTAYLERALKQFFPKKRVSQDEKRKQEEEVEKILKNLVTGQKTEQTARKKSPVKSKSKKKRKTERKSSIKIAKSL